VKVRRAAAVTGEREARALAALERGSAERGAALEQRAAALAEREAAVVAREGQLQELKVRWPGSTWSKPCTLGLLGNGLKPPAVSETHGLPGSGTSVD
jgi:hypothetical protein